MNKFILWCCAVGLLYLAIQWDMANLDVKAASCYIMLGILLFILGGERNVQKK